jgi:hypothetical protein
MARKSHWVPKRALKSIDSVLIRTISNTRPKREPARWRPTTIPLRFKRTVTANVCRRQEAAARPLGSQTDFHSMALFRCCDGSELKQGRKRRFVSIGQRRRALSLEDSWIHSRTKGKEDE